MEIVDCCVEELKQVGATSEGIMNDNENKSKSLRELFRGKYDSPQHPVFTPGDPPHALQCVFKDIVCGIPIPSDPSRISGIIRYVNTNKQCTIVADKFKNTRLKMFLKDELGLEDGRISINMPVITRWGTHLKMYQSVLKHKSEMCSIMNNTEAQRFCPAELKAIILSSEFWIQLDELANSVMPLVIAITNLEGDRSISNVLNEWVTLENTYSINIQSLIPSDVWTFVSARLQLRWKLISDEIHIAAYALDPRFRCNILSTNFARDAEATIQKVAIAQKVWHTSLFSEFSDFRNKQFPFENDVTLEEDPISYWKRLSYKAESQALAKIALAILGFPQTTASVERSFSSLRRIHTWERNSIGREKLSKLVYIYINRKALWECNRLSVEK